jgi:hypothetical protein
MADLIECILNAKLNKAIKSSSLTTKQGFIGMCSNCNKKMTSENSFNKHIRTQTCVPLDQRTYCKICDIVLDSRDAYKSHIMTREHVNNIISGDVDKLDISVLKVQKTQKNCGISKPVEESVSLVEDMETIDKIVDFKVEPKIEQKTSNIEVVLQDRMSIQQQFTDRQQKIIIFLKNIENCEDSANKFLIALNKLGLEDYKGLSMVIIQSDELKLTARQTYLSVISKYKELLQKKMISGKPTHNGVDINLILNALV